MAYTEENGSSVSFLDSKTPIVETIWDSGLTSWDSPVPSDTRWDYDGILYATNSGNSVIYSEV